MKKKKPIIFAALVVAAIVVIAVILQSSNWSNLSYEAVVQETVTMSNGEIRLIVERTTEIYGNPLNSLHISEDTKLLDMEKQAAGRRQRKKAVVQQPYFHALILSRRL